MYLADAFIQSDYNWAESMKVAQGSNSGSLLVLEFDLTTF